MNTVGFEYEIVHKPAFDRDHWDLDEETRKKVYGAIRQLRRDPFGNLSKRVFKGEYRNLYRYRIGDHRIIYTVGNRAVALYAVGKRDEIYKRMKRMPINGAATDISDINARPVALPTTADDSIPTRMRVGKDRVTDDEDTRPIDKPRSNNLLEQLLDFWDVDGGARAQILNCETVEEIIDLSLPQDVLQNVLHLVEPPNVRQISEQPTLELPDLDDLERHAQGELTSFLLRLDKEQESVARKNLKGPTIVKGGAGSGKSVVALYRIRRLMEPDVQRDLFGKAPPDVLFLTYTKALKNASEQMLRKLVGGDLNDKVRVKTINSLAFELFDLKTDYPKRTSDERLAELVDEAKHCLSREDAQFSQVVRSGDKKLDCRYLVEEFEWLIDGLCLSELEEYLSADRSGRGLAFDRRTREIVWAIYKKWRCILKREGVATYVQTQRRALQIAQNLPESAKFDVVVIDEAQDLKPVGIRLAKEMAKRTSGLYLTADERQSIYGRGFSWSRISEELDFRGKSTILRRNYRSSKAIAEAASRFLVVSGIEDSDRPSPVLDGPKPFCLKVKDPEDEARAVAHHIRYWSRDLRLPTWFGGVLVRRSEYGRSIASRLSQLGLKASFMSSAELDLDKDCVKVLTVHAAKGLEFPMVCVVGMGDGDFPSLNRIPVGEEDASESDFQERRLFHVAMMRAMRRLLITFPEQTPSPFIVDLDREVWNFQASELV